MISHHMLVNGALLSMMLTNKSVSKVTFLIGWGLGALVSYMLGWPIL
jgi:hypothetical protein